MDPLVLLFLALIVAVSGVIGVLADNLGRRLGKRRLTIFNLRPKHTGTLVTALAGMITSAITILLVFVFSRDVREWIVEGRAAIRNTQELNSKVKGLQSSADLMSRELTSLGSQKQSLSKTLAIDQKNLGDVENRLKDAQSRYSDAKAKAAAATQRLIASTAKLASTAQKLALASKSLAGVQRQLAALNQDYTELSKQRNEQFDEDRKLRDQKAALIKANTELTANFQTLQQTSNELSLKLKADQAAGEKAQADLIQAQNDLADGQEKLKSIQAQVQREELALAGYQKVAQAARTQPLIFAQGEELARVELKANPTRTDVTNALTHLMREARISAAKRGAAPRYPNGDSAGLVTQIVDNTPVKPEDQEEAITSRLVGDPHDVVLIAQSLLNSFRGEYVAVEIHGYNNPLVYKRRQVVASIRLNGRLPRERLLSTFQEFVRNEVVKSALAAGMIPIDGNANLVDVSPATTLSVVEQIAASSRIVRLSAVTTSDTRAADQLDLEFVLK